MVQLWVYASEENISARYPECAPSLALVVYHIILIISDRINIVDI
jgi:hypothetical protein